MTEKISFDENTYEVEVLAASVNSAGERVATIRARYPRFIHSEVMTHKDLSRNASSSRAIPVKTMLRSLWNNKAAPLFWGANQPGMQAYTELTPTRKKLAQFIWDFTGSFVIIMAWLMMKVGAHKQIVNRMIEPWSFIHVQITATDWSRFFKLRIHHAAQPEIQALAYCIREALRKATYREVADGDYHLPWITDAERQRYERTKLDLLLHVSGARSARLSYTPHGSVKQSWDKDLKLALGLIEEQHVSPFEHQLKATPGEKHANFQGWKAQRTIMGL